MANGDRLFIGIGGHVVAIDASSGQEQWRTKIASSTVTTVALVEGALYGAAHGVLARLDPSTGTTLWTNKLPWLGLGVVTFPGADSGALAAAITRANAAAAH
jgi:outer membrane protein assembly factor BamB